MPVTIHDIAHGDHVRIHFLPPLREDDIGEIDEARGTVVTVIDQIYVADELHKSGLGMPRMLRIDDVADLEIERVETADEIKARKARTARGEIVFADPPRDAEEMEEQLLSLAEMALAAPRRGLNARHDQLMNQFHDLADQIFLAKAKRTYLTTKALLGRDFHPWTDPDPAIFRIETVRPLPSDFELERAARRDRPRRLEEAVRIFGAAEREVREIASRLRAAGFDIRRPHPNAQSLLLRVALSARLSYDLAITASANGLWQLSLPLPSNKTQERARRRVLREGHLARIESEIAPLITP